MLHNNCTKTILNIVTILIDNLSVKNKVKQRKQRKNLSVKK